MVFINEKGVRKFTRDTEEALFKCKDDIDFALLQLKNLKVVEEMNGNFPTEDESRNPFYLTTNLQKAWADMQSHFNLYHNPKRLILTCTYRSPKKQKKLWLRGRLIPGRRVTNCDGYNKVSRHNLFPAEAFDVAVLLDNTCLWEEKEFEIVGKIGESLGLEWGGRWTKPVDRPHFQEKKGGQND